MVNALATSNPDCKIEFVTDLAPDADTQPSHYIMKGANFVTCISQNSKNPEHVVNWLNILTEPDNFRRTYIGEEGVSYEMIDGNYYPISRATTRPTSTPIRTPTSSPASATRCLRSRCGRLEPERRRKWPRHTRP